MCCESNISNLSTHSLLGQDIWSSVRQFSILFTYVVGDITLCCKSHSAYAAMLCSNSTAIKSVSCDDEQARGVSGGVRRLTAATLVLFSTSK
jgi:hypothetical protein